MKNEKNVYTMTVTICGSLEGSHEEEVEHNESGDECRRHVEKSGRSRRKRSHTIVHSDGDIIGTNKPD